MNEYIANEIVKLNKFFYNETLKGKSFSITRNSSWKGWGKLVSFLLEQRKEIGSVLDVASGNGRFYNELLSNKLWQALLNKNYTYLGLDTDGSMINEAKNRYGNLKFKEFDVINNLNLLVHDNVKYDLIVGFGIAHHIPSKRNRIKWFEYLAELLNQNGTLCITTWQFRGSKQFKHAVKEIKTNSISVDSDMLEDGDYFLGWDNEEKLYRYCHDYSDKELVEIESILRRKGVSLVKTFYEDGKSRDLNRYLIFKRN